MILGSLAIIVPQIATLRITLFLGWLLLAGGIIQMIRAVSIIKMSGFSLWFFLGILQSVIGYFFVAEPAQGSLLLTLFFILFFALEGIAKIYLALMMRPLAHWGWVLFSGITALCLAIAVWVGWPAIGFWVIGLLLGINMVFLGWSLINMDINKPQVIQIMSCILFGFKIVVSKDTAAKVTWMCLHRILEAK